MSGGESSEKHQGTSHTSLRNMAILRISAAWPPIYRYIRWYIRWYTSILLLCSIYGGLASLLPVFHILDHDNTESYEGSSHFHASSAVISLLLLVISCISQPVGSVIAAEPKFRRWQRLCPITCAADVLFAIFQILGFLLRGFGFRAAVYELLVTRLILMDSDFWEDQKRTQDPEQIQMGIYWEDKKLSQDRIQKDIFQKDWIESYENHRIFRVITALFAVLSYANLWSVKGISFLQYLATMYFTCWLFFESLLVYAGPGLMGYYVSTLDPERFAPRKPQDQSHSYYNYDASENIPINIFEFFILSIWVAQRVGMNCLLADKSGLFDIAAKNVMVLPLFAIATLLEIIVDLPVCFYLHRFVRKVYPRSQVGEFYLLLVYNVIRFLIMYFCLFYSEEHTAKVAWTDYLGWLDV